MLAVALLLTAAVLLHRPPSATEDQPPSTVRRATVAVPPGISGPSIQFVDRNAGYALFHGCEECPATMFGTVDGGVSWHRITHPATGRVALYGSPRALVLWWMSRDVWLMSTDRGANWTRIEPWLAPYRGARGLFQSGENGQVVFWRDGRPQRVPEPPPLPFVSAVATGADGRSWAVCRSRDGVLAVLSVDGGRSWTTTPVPQQGGWPVSFSVLISADGRDVWLVGTPGDPYAFPLIWTFVAGRWLPVSPSGRPPTVTAVVPVGGGALVVAGLGGIGAVRHGRYWPIPDWPARDLLTLLEDGTIVAQDGTSTWLGAGFDTARRWTRIDLNSAG
ncbi:hypothetical protein JCM9534A_45520 [Catenuloplanes indicus JCM 9534]